MDGQEQETWTADDVDVPPGLSEMSSAISQAPPGSSAPPAASSASPARRRPRSGVDSEAAAEQSLTLERLLGSPSSLRRATSVGGESSVPDHLRRTSAWRLSGPGRVVSDPLGMSLPNDRIELRGRDRARGRQAERVERAERTERTERAERAERTERTERQLPFPWAAHRPGFYYDYSTEVLRSIDSTDRIEEPRSSAQNAARDEARQQLESASTRDEQTMSRLRERSATILNLAAQRRNTSSSIAIPGGRGMISTGPQQVVPTNSHFSWASFGAGTSNVDRRATPAAIALSAASQRPPPTATTPAADAQPEPPASPDAATTSRSERSALTVLRRRRTDTDTAVRSLVERMNEAGRESASSSRQAYAFDPTDISPPGGGDDHIWDFLGMPDSDDDNVSRWGTYRTTDVLRAGRGALPASTPLAHLLDLDAWGSPPDAGAALSRGRFNRRRRSSVRSRETHDEQPVVSMGDDAIMVEVPTPTRRYPPTNTAPSQTPVVVGDERARRRRDSGAESSNDNPWPSKRVRRDPSWPDTTPPTYSSLSSLPGSTPLPTDFAPPTRDSWLGLSCHEIRGVSRPVVTFELTRAASMIIDDTESDACALRANVPIPADIGVHYYEVEVLECGEGYLTVGWMQSQVSLNRLVGWDPGSWGWHGVDGQTFEGSVGRGEGNDFGDAWGTGDIVGCGVDYTTGRAFFTLNGKLVGHVFSKLPQGLYPAVGLRSPGESLAVNFTGPFVYDIDKHVHGIRDRVRAVLKPPRETFSSMSKVVPVPRLAGLPGRAVPRPTQQAELPADSPLQFGADRAAAAFVLDHLVTSGHGRVASSLLRDMQARGWIARRESDDESQAAKVADVARALRDGSVLWDDLRALDAGSGGAWAHLERRLSVYAFAQSALAGGEDAVATGRDLRRRAKDERWNVSDVELLDAAASSLVGAEDQALVDARQVDAVELERVLRDAQGLKQRSCLHMAVAQTELVHEVLIGRADGEAAFLGLDAVL